MRLLTALTVSLMFAGPLAAQQTVTLRNGDRYTGRLRRIEGTAWVFRLAGGELKVEAADVAGFSAPDRIGVRLADGAILAATIVPSGALLELRADDGTTRTVGPLDIAAVGNADNVDALVPVRIGFFSPIGHFWSATAALGFSNKSGNSRNRGLTGEIEIGRRSPRDRLLLKVGTVREETDPGTGTLEPTVEKYYGSARADLFFGSRVFVFASTAQERDEFQDIDLRSSYNGGFGVQVLATDNTDLRFYASGGLRREAFTSNGSESTPILGAGTGIRRVLGPATFNWSVDWAPSAEDLQDYRFVSDASLTLSLIKGLGFRIASRNELNNRPRPGIEKHDWLLTTTLTYTIGK